MILEKVKARKGVVAVTERVRCEALIGTSENSRGVVLMGIDPLREVKVTRLAEFVHEGDFLSPNDDRSILVGDRLAQKLSLQRGDKIVVMTHAQDGTLAGFPYRVKGIFHSGSQTLDEMSAYITLASAQALLGLEGEIHETVIRLKHRKMIPEFLAQIAGIAPTETYEILTWNQIVPEAEQWAV